MRKFYPLRGPAVIAMDEATGEALASCAELIASADGLLITAGAGMGVDSGLPDFRGRSGFWRAYPALHRAGLEFTRIANPAAFAAKPRLAWGFYGHRLNLYRSTVPHAGFTILLDLTARLEHGAFVFTSNVDGHFQKAGFADDRVCECHGSIHHLQCARPCSRAIWPADAFRPVVDSENCLLDSPLPSCPNCGGLARPNILMFGDADWIEDRTAEQEANCRAWLARVRRPVVIELGAGLAVPAVRLFGESLGWPMIRINPTEWQVRSARAVGIALGAKEGLERIAQVLK